MKYDYIDCCCWCHECVRELNYVLLSQCTMRFVHDLICNKSITRSCICHNKKCHQFNNEWYFLPLSSSFHWNSCYLCWCKNVNVVRHNVSIFTQQCIQSECRDDCVIWKGEWLCDLVICEWKDQAFDCSALCHIYKRFQKVDNWNHAKTSCVCVCEYILWLPWSNIWNYIFVCDNLSRLSGEFKFLKIC
jgi:hypothetical protein